VCSSDLRLAFGFSKTGSPSTLTTDWCKYTIFGFGSTFPDFPKLGDSKFFMIIGVNDFNSSDVFIGSALITVDKPPSGTTCPSITVGSKFDLRDTSNNRTFTPVPSQQVDNSSTGYVIARNGTVPSSNLWFYNVKRNSSGAPIFGAARALTVPTYTVPPNAVQPTFSQLLDTSDARNTQAVQATNPDRNTFSFWTQHTVANGSASQVRWYEIDPVPSNPVLLRSDIITGANTFFFNAAISPDRQRNGKTFAFGDSFVIEYNVSSSTIPARITAGSSFSGGGLSFTTVKNGVGPYRDFSCDTEPVCRWGDYAAATPDPNPPTSRPRTDRGEVWGTNQFSGVSNPPASGVSWRTQNFALQP